MHCRKWIFTVMAVLSLVAAVRAEPYADKPGPHETATIEANWTDAQRDREVPVAIWYPKDIAAGTPVIIFSHGLGGSRDTYAPYGKHWASYGYVVVFPQHHGSDTASLGKGAVRDEPKNYLDRAQDIHYVLDQIELLNAGKLAGKDYAPLAGKLDLKKIGMSGHSFGAITTQAVVGEAHDLNLGGKEIKFADPRIVAGMAMSPYPPFRKNQDLDAIYGAVKVPVFYLTGTEDDLGAKAEDRRIPFDHSKVPGTAFLYFTGADHMTFTPLGTLPKSDKANFQKIIRESTTAYWDAMLKGDEKAKAWLTGGLAKELGTAGTFEMKK